MPLDPRARAYIDKLHAAGEKPVAELTVAEARAQSRRLAAQLGPGEPVARVEELVIPLAGRSVPARLYAPASRTPLGVYVFFHGGGWVRGDLETGDFVCRAMAAGAGCLVVSVNYRHAPEHTFPTAVEDAYDATVWVADHAAGLGGDASRLAVGGYSAGGTLAAVVTQLARDRRGPRIVFQLLQAPATNYAFDTGSYRENAEGYVLTTRSMQWFWNHYLRSEADGESPLASPLRTPDLRALPPAFIMTAEYDPLRDEGEAYAQRLREAGVAVTATRYAGMIHVFFGPDAIPDMAGALRGAFARKL
ncbi:MAG TPA: alpha/beta hydrolase [Vicinamibacterales bacterium]|nr:alpha/beta hydrolase [Vicinamibacterales bacterium]